jgi:hypothetical protein
MELQRGDNDNAAIWGGESAVRAPEFTVMALQSRLHSIGLYLDSLDGIFGPNTEKALKIFQWCLKHAVYVMKEDMQADYSPTVGTELNGRCGSSTRSMLETWFENQYIATGDLVRVSTAELSNIQLSPMFSQIGGPVVDRGEFLIARAAAPMIGHMNAFASELDLVVSINQSLRILGSEVRGAVVKPATRSQHYIGHAIDCNLVDGDNWNTTSDFRNKTQTANADRFILAMRNAGYRWGGDFSRTDPPHFDSQLNPQSFDYDAKVFLNQKQISAGEPIEKLPVQ